MTGNDSSTLRGWAISAKCAKEKGPLAKCERAVKQLAGVLPVQLEGELELAGVVGGCRLAGEAT
jgi:hypothetical protein